MWEVLLQNSPQSRAALRSICTFGSTTHLATNFHQNHTTSPLSWLGLLPGLHRLGHTEARALKQTQAT
jgi:hypothetical protein